MEAPRDVYRAAVDQLAESLTAGGWRYARSGPHLTRRIGEVKQSILFTSSHYNDAGSTVTIAVAAIVEDRRHGRWRYGVGLGDRPVVVAANVGNLPGLGDYITWNLAAPQHRPQLLAEIERVITGPVMRFLDEIIVAVDHDDVDPRIVEPLVDPHVAVEYFFRSGDAAGAARLVERQVVVAQPDAIEVFLDRALVARSNGLGAPRFPSVWTDLADLTVRFDLPVDLPGLANRR